MKRNQIHLLALVVFLVAVISLGGMFLTGSMLGNASINFFSVPETNPLLSPTTAPATNSPISLRSKFFSSDHEIQDFIKGTRILTLPSADASITSDQWKIISGLRIIGYEEIGMPWGLRISQEEVLEIDNNIDERESTIYTQATKLAFYKDHSAPDFKANLPQEFAAYLFATVFDLFNSGPKKYFSYTYGCLSTVLSLTMRGSLVNFGDTTPLIIQTPELFGFNNRRDAISQNELPRVVGNTIGYVGTLMHEFTHYLHWDSTLQACGTESFINFQKAGSPFVKRYAPGRQNLVDFVSGYASGLTNQNRDYRWTEDVAESMTAFILTPQYFREKAKESELLLNKYNFIKDEVFGGREFFNPDLDNFYFEKPIDGTMVSAMRPVPFFVLSNIFSNV